MSQRWSKMMSKPLYSRSDAIDHASPSSSSPIASSLASAGASQYGRIVVPDALNCSMSDFSLGYLKSQNGHNIGFQTPISTRPV